MTVLERERLERWGGPFRAWLFGGRRVGPGVYVLPPWRWYVTWPLRAALYWTTPAARR